MPLRRLQRSRQVLPTPCGSSQLPRQQRSPRRQPSLALLLPALALATIPPTANAQPAATIPPAATAQPAAPVPADPNPLAALIQLKGEPLSGGRALGQAQRPLERAAGGDTPVLSFRTAMSPGRGAGGGASVRLLLDTGASSTMVTPELAARLGLASLPLPPEVFALAGGGAGCGDLAPRRTRLPDLVLRGSPPHTLVLQGIDALVLPVAALPTGVDGVLGAPSLRLLPLLVDPGASSLILGPAAIGAFAAATGVPEAAATGSHTVPLRWRSGVPLFRLASQPPSRGQQSAAAVEALADSGAEGLFISPALAARLQPQGPSASLRLVGICGDQRVVRQRFRGLRLPAAAAAGGERNATDPPAGEGIEAIVTANPIFAALGVEAIAGQEWLRQRTQLWRLDLDPPLLLLR